MNLNKIFILAISTASTFGITAPLIVPAEVIKQIPAKYNLEDPQNESARKELEQLVKDCGAGVVKGVSKVSGQTASNRCSFQVELNDLFFESPQTKYGLLHDKDWAYQDGVEWYTPAKLDVPEKFDLRDLMEQGVPVIKKQQCGDCWAWSTHHGLEIARAVHDGQVVDHSIQTVLSCSKAGSCRGGYMSAVDFLLHGLPEESDFPYAAYDKQCRYSSKEISNGWDPKALSTPYVGDSKRYSLAMRRKDGSFREGTKVKEMMAAMYDSKGPLVVTVSAYSLSGSGVYNSCSSINSGGNHMVAVVGWDSENDKRNAHVWNSWGPDHGENGVSRIQWECGDGRLNRGLGVSAKIVQYKSTCVPPKAGQQYLHEIKKGESVQIGVENKEGTTCQWAPTVGLNNPNSCTPIAKPEVSTEYHLTATNACGTSSSMTLVSLWQEDKSQGQKVLTPHGKITVRR